MNKWFEDKFLLSLFNQCGVNNHKWLTQKQTAICVQYMKRETISFTNGFDTYKHDNYKYFWEGREVILCYSKKNGCGTITFSKNKSEIAEAQFKAQKEKEKIHFKNIQRAKANPARLQERINSLKYQVDNLKQNIKLDIEEGYTENIQWQQEKLQELEKELELYLK